MSRSQTPLVSNGEVVIASTGTGVFNYLQWASPEHLARMQRSPEFQQLGRRFAGLITFEPHQREVVHVGEPERPDQL